MNSIQQNSAHLTTVLSANEMVITDDKQGVISDSNEKNRLFHPFYFPGVIVEIAIISSTDGCHQATHSIPWEHHMQN